MISDPQAALHQESSFIYKRYHHMSSGLLWQTFVKLPQYVGYIHKCQLKLYCAKRKPYVNSVQKRRRLLWLGGIWDGPSHSGNVYCGQMNQYFRYFWEEWTPCAPDQRRKGSSRLLPATSPKARVCHGMGLCQCPWQR